MFTLLCNQLIKEFASIQRKSSNSVVQTEKISLHQHHTPLTYRNRNHLSVVSYFTVLQCLGLTDILPLLIHTIDVFRELDTMFKYGAPVIPMTVAHRMHIRLSLVSTVLGPYGMWTFLLWQSQLRACPLQTSCWLPAQINGINEFTDTTLRDFLQIVWALMDF